MKLHVMRKAATVISAVCFVIALAACGGSDSSSKSKKTGNVAPTNQDAVFSSSKKVSDGDLVAIASSGVASNSVWFAPAGTTTFKPGVDMTKAASGTATTIATPTTLGEYHLYLVSAAGKVSNPSAAVLTVTEWVQDAYLKASNNDVSNDQFGTSVAIDGDFIVVGAYGEDSNATTVENEDGSPDTDFNGGSAIGAAYVFKRGANGNWNQDAYLKASNSSNFDEFGKSVAISGDFIVVGAHGEDSTADEITNNDGSPDTDIGGSSNSGAAYVFKRKTGGNWVQDAYLKASNNTNGDHFGHSVAISGNFIVVGVAGEDSTADVITNDDGSADTDNSAENSGAAYVFKRKSSGEWVQDAYLKASNNDATNDQFGKSVAISGNFIVVGASLEDSDANVITNDDGSADTDNSAEDSGAAYVFKRDATGDWIQDAYLKASNSDTNDYFGFSVAISGDRIVVGAYGEDSNADIITNDDGSADTNNGSSSSGSGAAYIFKRESGIWIQDAYLKVPNRNSNDLFGWSVAISGDLVVVGATGEDSNAYEITNTDGTADTDDSAENSGAAYLFKRDVNGEWVQDAYLKASNNDSSDDHFGNSVAISGDRVVVGAYKEDSNEKSIDNGDGSASTDNSATDSGAAYIFKR